MSTHREVLLSVDTTVRPGTGGLGAHLLESLPASSAKEVVVHGDANPTRPERYSSSSHRQHPATPHDAEAPAVGADIAFAKCGTSDRWRRSRSPPSDETSV